MRKLILILAFSLTLPALARNNYTGYSGAPGSRGTCASSCHGGGGGTVTVTGFPETYAPGQSYTISIQRSSGSSIGNFNASCRIGTGSNPAGVLSGGTNTATYNVSQETNGVHLSSNNQTSGTFNWQAPASGTGPVRLYVAAHQGNYSGANTEIVFLSEESAAAPGMATNPAPLNEAVNIGRDVLCEWTAGSGATSHDVYFGLAHNLQFMANVSAPNFDPPDSLLVPNTPFYWRIDERNDNGVTEGTVWTFTTMSLPPVPSLPSPADGSLNIAISTNLDWQENPQSLYHDLALGTTFPLNIIWSQLAAPPLYNPPVDLLPDTIYYWQAVDYNSFGSTAGPVWSFRTEVINGTVTPKLLPATLTLEPAFPNPFNSTTSARLTVPATTQATLSLFDVNGRLVQTIFSGELTVGQHLIHIDAHDLSTGDYFIRLISPDGIQSIKLTLLR